MCGQSCLLSTGPNAQETAEPRLVAGSRPHDMVEEQHCQLWPSTGGDGSGGGFQPRGHSQRKDLQRLLSYSGFRAGEQMVSSTTLKCPGASGMWSSAGDQLHQGGSRCIQLHILS